MKKLHPAVGSAAPSEPTVKPAPFIANRILWLAAGLFLVAGLFLLGGWWLRPPELHGVLLQSPRQADDFTLTSSSGDPVQLSDLRGKFVMLYFGYTYCPDVCPTTLNDLALMAKTLGDKKMEDVQVVLVSVDPERDTPEHLARYLPAFHRSFVGMTGTVEQIQAVASQFGIYFERHPADEQGNYLVDHTSAVTVLDPEGYVCLVLPYGVSGQDMAADVQYLMRRY